MKRIFAFMICIAIVITCLISCETSHKDDISKNSSDNINADDEKNNSDYVYQTAEGYELRFTSNGDGTCVISGVYVNDETKATVLDIPNTSSIGERVVGFNVDTIEKVPKYILVDDFEKYVLSKEGLLNGKQILQLQDSYKKYDLNDPKYTQNLKLKEEALRVHPILAKSPVYVCTIRTIYEYDELDLLYTQIGLDYNARQNLIKKLINVTSCEVDLISRLDTFKEIKIPSSVNSIKSGALRDFDNLETITVDENNTAYKLVDGNLYSKDGKQLVKYITNKTNTSFTIPNEVTKICMYAFFKCNNLKNVVFGNNAISIEKNAFGYCSELESITIGEQIVNVVDDIFYHCLKLKKVQYTGTLSSWCNLEFKTRWLNFKENIYFKNDNGEYELLTNLVIPEGVTEIKKYAFEGCDSITSVVIPDHVTSIGKAAFESCGGLQKVIIGSGVASIEEGAFYNAGNLADVEFSDTTNWFRCGSSNSDDEVDVPETSFEDNTIAAKILKKDSSSCWKRG